MSVKFDRHLRLRRYNFAEQKKTMKISFYCLNVSFHILINCMEIIICYLRYIDRIMFPDDPER